MMTTKLVKHEGNGVDRLSDLPDSVLAHILSFVPTKYAIRTSVLSSRWRSIHTSVSTLDFHSDENPSDRFMNFVDRVISFHVATCLERFRLLCGYGILSQVDTDPGRICAWTSFALGRRVQELSLKLSIRDTSGLLPASLFSNTTLVKLEINISDLVLTIPTQVCFPSLKSLHLVGVKFADDDSVRRLLAGCLVLQDLYIYSRFWDNVRELNISIPSLKRLTLNLGSSAESNPPSHVAIDAPSLIYFRFCSILGKSYSLVNLHSLVTAAIYFFVCSGEKSVNHDAASNFFNGISNVQLLYCNEDLPLLLSLCKNPMPMFYNLVHLDIERRVGSLGIGLAKLLECSIKLKTLIICNGYVGDLLWHPPEEVPSCLLSHLKVIEIYLFAGDMEMVEYFLKNGRVLEELRIEMARNMEKEAGIVEKLLKLPRESKICQVQTFQYPSMRLLRKLDVAKGIEDCGK